MQAWVWYRQRRLEEAKTEALCAFDAFEKLGVVKGAERVRGRLRQIDDEIQADGTSDKQDDSGGLLETVSVADVFIDSSGYRVRMMTSTLPSSSRAPSFYGPVSEVLPLYPVSSRL